MLISTNPLYNQWSQVHNICAVLTPYKNNDLIKIHDISAVLTLYTINDLIKIHDICAVLTSYKINDLIKVHDVSAVLTQYKINDLKSTTFVLHENSFICLLSSSLPFYLQSQRTRCLLTFENRKITEHCWCGVAIVFNIQYVEVLWYAHYINMGWWGWLHSVVEGAHM